MSEIDDFLDKLDQDKEESKKINDDILRKKAEAVFENEDREKKINDYLSDLKRKKIHMRRKEKRMIKNGEYDSTDGKTREMVIGLAVVGIIFLVVMNNITNNAFSYYILMIIGSMMFFPIGMIAGWMVFDPVIRCKILKRMTKRNYGLVVFMGQGNKGIMKIKNFDNGLIWREKECWILAKNKIIQITKNGNAITQGKTLDANKIITLVDTVPVIFVDINSMEPLSISREGRATVHPQEIGSSLKAWVDNQRAKMIAARKTMDTVYLIILVCSAGALATSFMAMQKVDDLTTTVTGLKNQLKTILDILQQTPP